MSTNLEKIRYPHNNPAGTADYSSGPVLKRAIQRRTVTGVVDKDGTNRTARAQLFGLKNEDISGNNLIYNVADGGISSTRTNFMSAFFGNRTGRK